MLETAAEDVRLDIISSVSEPHRSSFLSQHKRLIAAALAVSLSTVVAIAVSLSTNTRSNAYSFSNTSNSSDGVAKTKIDPSNKITEGDITITNFSGNISDFIVTNQVVVRQSTIGANDCPFGESLWNLLLITDDYPWETKWELYDSNSGSVLASGPSEGENYGRRTRYTHNLCLPVGQYYMRWFDLTGDGLCCEYGPGEWAVSVNGEVVLENDPKDSNFTQKDFPFQVTATSSEMTGTFLIMPRPYDPVMNVELPDGTIFELSNLPPDFEYTSSALVSGITSIALPTGAELFSNGTADMKGEAPRVFGRLLLDDHHKDIEGETSSSTTKRMQEQGGNLRASSWPRQLAIFDGDQTVLAVRVIAADGTTTADETFLSNSIFGNGVDPANLVSQFKACSYGIMNLIKAPTTSGRSKNSGDVDISNGVVTVRLPSISTIQGDGTMRNAITKELNEIFGVASPSQLADYVIYCLPGGTYSKIAYAYINNWLSVFNDDWCTSVSLQMHEIGHNINFGHSNEEGSAYEDETGIMGYSYPNKDTPLTCFNAAKSWQTGWYRDKGITINSSGATTCFGGILHGVADYPVATTVLLRVQTGSGPDYYVNFNAKKGINSGTQEGGDQVTVVSRPRGARDSYAESELAAKLGSGESYTFSGYSISVGGIDKNVGTAEVMVLPTAQNECDTT